MKLDIEFVRKQFNQLHDNPEFVFCSNAGGSYVANQVNTLMNHYNSHTRVQPYERYAPSSQAGEAMDRAIEGWAEALNISANELTIGPSTSMNTYVMAQAIGVDLGATDEIIVTNQDHEANSGVWRRKAEEKGAKIREWKVDLENGLLNLQQLDSLVNENTKWVFFAHCSNIVGTSNPASEITRRVKQNSNAKVFVDAVAHAPHHICDLKALGVDGYAFSLYKVYGPHQGLMYLNREIASNLTPQCHYFNIGDGKLFNPAGPQHAQVAACAGVLDYFDALHQHHFKDTLRAPQRMAPQKMTQLHSLISAHETELAAPILDFLGNNDKVRLLGKNHTRDNDRVPTIAFQPLKQSARAVSTKIQDMGIGCESGHFYAHRLLTDLGINADDGVVRVSLVHYNSTEEVEKILMALERAINH
ncbi:aminotransferase class V-fold PLP-dependent enzyme [Candidatus Spongiihabitans sp.]|uniref:aminotransferase class V-fold PLP-dependent enzyme n=1 Tax=Candidatus Spongiihabitans sp. TaxID=3101308 RepID=UPI003C705BE6